MRKEIFSRFGCNSGMILLGILVLIIPRIQADVVTFQGGEQLHGEIYRQDGDYISMKLVSGGDIMVGRDFIRSVVKEAPEIFYVKRGDMLLERKEYGKALVEYLQASQRNPGQDWIQERIDRVERIQSEDIGDRTIQRAQILLKQNSFRQAINLLQEAVPKVPRGEVQRRILKQLATVQSHLAYHYFNHCFEELALEELAKAEEYDPQCADIYYVLGRINHSQSRYQTARREYQKALELQPEMESARDFLLKLENDSRRYRAVF